MKRQDPQFSKGTLDKFNKSQPVFASNSNQDMLNINSAWYNRDFHRINKERVHDLEMSGYY